MGSSCFVWNIDSGLSFVFNESGAFAWHHLREGNDLDTVIRLLAANYDLSFRHAEADVLSFLARLHSFNLIAVSTRDR